MQLVFNTYTHMFSIRAACIALLYLANLASMASLSKQSENTMIDNIMDQLLNSKKMDKLVDKIANKAAEKIADIQHINIAPTSDHMGEKVNRAIEDVEKIDQNKESTKTAVTDTNTEITENPDISAQDTSSNEDKNSVDGLAVMEEIASIPKEKVNINYQRFTTKDANQPGADATDKTLQQLIDSDERRADEKEKQSQEKLKDQKSNSNKKRKHKKNKKTTTKAPVIEDDLEVYETVDDDHKKDSNLKVKDSKNITKDQSDSDSDSNKVVTTNDELPNKPSTKIAKRDKIKKQSSKGSQSDFIEDELADAVGNITDSDTRHIVRKQGDKLFAFVDNEDYNEYHDELSKKIKKSKKKKKTRRVEVSSSRSE